MPTARDNPSWWQELPMSDTPIYSDLCKHCGVARWRHIQQPQVAGCKQGTFPDAPYHVAGLPADYRYDKLPKDFTPRDGENPYFWYVPPAYLRSIGLL